MCGRGSAGDHAIGIPGPQVGWELGGGWRGGGGVVHVVWALSILARVRFGGGEAVHIEQDIVLIFSCSK